ncbi:MAG TPA: aminotransferase class IV [Gemmatimonadales bacterium]|nr:aminotransferase class IV [Gemmatimonadales bacterium]
MLVYLNGAYLESADARISLDDRGFLFGDGVYEVTRALGGRLFAGDRHLRRLERGMRELELRWPDGLDAAGLRAVSERLLHENGLAEGEATVYAQITRGAAPRTHAFPPPGTPPTVYVAAGRFKPIDELRGRGAAAITIEDIRWGRCDLKTIQLLPNVLARQRAARADAFDAVQVRDGVVTEGASTNLFAVLDGVVRTHPADRRILAGVTREIVLELARELGLSAREEAIAVAELSRGSEVFLTGTTTDVMPVARLDGRPVGAGRPGPVARQLHAKLRGRMEQGAQVSAIR